PPAAFDDATRAAHQAALRATDVAQPALGAVSIGALRILERFGFEADAAIGHSYGELVALCAAGKIQLAELHRLSHLRGQLMAVAGRGREAGGMLAVHASPTDVQAIVEQEALDLVMANKNAPRQTVLSGPRDLIERAANGFAARGMHATPLP